MALVLPLILPLRGLRAQTPANDTAGQIQKEQTPNVTLTSYVRVITDANGAKRMDENILSNFKVFSWLRLEVGFRQGERPEYFDAYYHYKVELQTKLFWNTVRGLARISDNVINIPSNSYRKTNRLFAVEIKRPLSSRFLLNAGLGYVFSSKENNITDALPTSKGIQAHYPVFKLGLRYKITRTSYAEMLYGSYDVFNPYYYTSPFVQLSAERALSERLALFSYFRYQYNEVLLKPNTYFLAFGVRFYPSMDK